MAGPDPATTEWVPVWNPVAIGPPGPPGPAGGAIAAAKYWVVEPFSGLVNARALNSLANGYVKSNAGEPFTTATIPLTDTTGTLPDARLTSNVALRNTDNNFTPQTFAPGSRLYGSGGLLYFQDPTAGPNLKHWRITSFADGNLHMDKIGDDLNTLQARFSFGLNQYFYALGYVGDGANISNLGAANIAFGLVNPARLGSGTANSTTYLRGDNTWGSAPGFPPGLIAISSQPCPPGWARVAVWDGYYLRSGPTNVAGGSSSHSHDAGSYYAVNHDHGGIAPVNGVTNVTGGHGHGISGSGSGTTGSFDTAQVADAGSNYAHVGAHRHDFSVNISGSADYQGDHAHTVNINGGIPGSGGVAVAGNSGVASNMPLYVDVILCQKL